MTDWKDIAMVIVVAAVVIFLFKSIWSTEMTDGISSPCKEVSGSEFLWGMFARINSNIDEKCLELVYGESKEQT